MSAMQVYFTVILRRVRKKLGIRRHRSKDKPCENKEVAVHDQHAPPCDTEAPRRKFLDSQRSLITIEDSNGTSKIVPQMECPLLQLPYEIRQIIWSHYAGGNTIHLRVYEGRPGPVGIRQTRCFKDGTQRRPCAGCHRGIHTANQVIGNSSDSGDTDVVALLYTCRQIYSEVITKIMGCNTFTSCHLQTVLSMREYLLSQRIQAIKYFRFHIVTYYAFPSPPSRVRLKSQLREWKRWANTWGTFSKMKGLRDLRIVFDTTSGGGLQYLNEEESKECLEPIALMNKPPYFELQLPIQYRSQEAWQSLDCNIVWFDRR